MIEFKNVYIKYVEDFFALHNFCHIFDANTLLIGDKFSGADTVLRLIAKFDKSFDGEILFDNKSIRNLTDKEIDVSFISDEPYLFKLKSLEYNLAYPLKIRKEEKQIVNNNVNNILTKFNLSNFKKIKSLTFSQQKIVTLLRALIRKPKYVLLEYFFENLDKDYISLAEEILTEISQNSIVIACENTVCESLKNYKIIDMIN